MQLKASVGPENPMQTVQSGDSAHKDRLRLIKALQVISEESNVSIDKLTDDIVFVDLGIDPLLSLNMIDTGPVP